ncbi:MAG: glutamyl-tRNA reductase [Candidatus Omnitrophota bacterium]
MNIQILGLNHKTAPIEIRETVSFTSQGLLEALVFLKRYESIKENLILSTCNRVEIYAVTDDLRSGTEAIRRFLYEFHRIDRNRLQKHLYFFNDINAIRHLFRVVSSLDSMIVGETQIFGQVKQAYSNARDCRVIGKIFRSLFEEAIKVGKKIRTQTQIGKGAVSISSASVELAKKIFENLKGIKILIIGAGKIGELAVKSLSSRGASAVLVANRTFERAQDLAKSFGGAAVRFENFFEYMKDVDIIISSTAAAHFVIDKDDLSRVMHQRNQRPIFLIDLGLPRNIDPEAGKLDNIYLYNIDDLAKVRDANLKERMREAKRAEEIIEKSIESTVKKLNLNGAS